MTRPLKACISRGALIHNYQQVRLSAPHSKLLAVIKADAYGHGAVEVAHTLQQVDGFAVASLEEALCLRAAQIKQPIVLLGGFFHEDELKTIVAHQLQTVIHHPEQVALLQHSGLTQPLDVWLHVDTAMRNVGLMRSQLSTAIKTLQTLPSVRIQTVMTHFAHADDKKEKTTVQQLAEFNQLTADYDFPLSMANSAGILAWQDTHSDWVRPGLMLYGAAPLKNKTAHDVQLKPVMILESKLIAVREAKKGDRVGYGGTWCCPQRMLIGTVAIGYGDGYPRHAPTGTPVLVKGHRAQLIGTVAMDLLTVDLRGVPNPQLGDRVVLWGDDLPVERIAQHTQTVSHHCLSSVSQRVPRHYHT